MYGRKQTPPIVAKVDDKNAKSTEDITKQIQQILSPAAADAASNKVLEDKTVKSAIAYYKLKKNALDNAYKAADEAHAKSDKARYAASDKARVDVTDKARKASTYKTKVAASDKAAEADTKKANVAKEALQQANDAKEALQQAINKYKYKENTNPDENESIDKAINESIAKTNPLSDNSKQQLTIALPFFLQIYESLYDDKNYEGSTQISRHTTIPNRAIMEYVVREIQKIEKNHPHPQLFESIFYFWNIFAVGH